MKLFEEFKEIQNIGDIEILKEREKDLYKKLLKKVDELCDKTYEVTKQ